MADLPKSDEDSPSIMGKSAQFLSQPLTSREQKWAMPLSELITQVKELAGPDQASYL